HTLGPNDRLIDAHTLMLNKNIRHVPIVTEDGLLLGIVSHRDLLLATPNPCFEHQSNAFSKTTIYEIFRTGIETITSDSGARLAALTLEKFKIGCLPVVDNERLVGIVTSSDFVAISINLMEQFEIAEQEAMEF
ncbi:MAG: CBS domain-containing protein, partial [Gammaproteobacteria bacterium]|nr:CBS domain-containing protein [Gammaproteobacteria bacterium]